MFFYPSVSWLSATKFIYVLGIAALLSSCGQSTREDVIERYEGGEKKIVAVYEGAGVDEKLIERRTYDQDGTNILVENIPDGTTIGWAEINAVASPDGIAEALKGEWTGTDFVGRSLKFVFEGNKGSLVSRYADDEKTNYMTLHYLPDYRVKVEMTDELGSPVEEEQDPEFTGPRHEIVAVEFLFNDHQSFDAKAIFSIDSRLEFATLIGFFHRSPTYIEEQQEELQDRLLKASTQHNQEYFLLVLKDKSLRETYPEWHEELVIVNLVSEEVEKQQEQDPEWWRTPFEERQSKAREAVLSRNMASDQMRSAAIRYLETQLD